jgi:hypothetical protein
MKSLAKNVIAADLHLVIDDSPWSESLLEA